MNESFQPSWFAKILPLQIDCLYAGTFSSDCKRLQTNKPQVNALLRKTPAVSHTFRLRKRLTPSPWPEKSALAWSHSWCDTTSWSL